jgi:alpha-tubulin suppressor-like RCC1 family protein
MYKVSALLLSSLVLSSTVFAADPGDRSLVSTGAAHSMAVRADGSLWTWGANTSNQLAVSGSYKSTPQYTGLTGIISVSAGYLYSMAIDSDGAVWAWGSTAAASLVWATPPTAAALPF